MVGGGTPGLDDWGGTPGLDGGGYPRSGWWGVPSPGWWGVSHSWMVGSTQVLDGGGVPHPRCGWWGVPHPRFGWWRYPRSGWWGGTSSQVWMVEVPQVWMVGGTPVLDGGYPGYPPIRQNSIASTCYPAGGMPLAFTQEDFLVYSENIYCLITAVV